MVVMVILIIAAIAIPSLVHAKMKANEASAVASVKQIQVAETLYFNTYPDTGYAGSLPVLGRNGSDCENPTRTNSCIITDDLLTSGMKSGYVFELLNDGKTPSLSYTVDASPESNATGRCSVGSDQTGQVHFTTVAASGGGGGGRSVGSGGGNGGCDP